MWVLHAMTCLRLKVATLPLKPTNKSWRVDETYVRVKDRWYYLYRAIDSRGATIDFLLAALRDADAAKRLFRKALGDRSILNLE
jgi:transposase-like protein